MTFGILDIMLASASGGLFALTVGFGFKVGWHWATKLLSTPTHL